MLQEPIGGDPNNKREREINPSVAMVLEDKDMRSGTVVRKRKIRGQPYIGRTRCDPTPGPCFYG